MVMMHLRSYTYMLYVPKIYDTVYTTGGSYDAKKLLMIPYGVPIRVAMQLNIQTQSFLS